MSTLTRREFVTLAAAVPLAALAQKAGRMYFCMNEVSSANVDFRAAMEGYGRAGVTHVELFFQPLSAFVMKESPAVARRVLGDAGLTPVSMASAGGIVEPTATRAASVETWKARLDLARNLGVQRYVVPILGTQKYTEADYKAAVDNLRDAGEIATSFGITAQIEFTRTSTLAASLRTALKLVREADHPSVRVMIDTFHFWAGPSKFEELEELRDSEVIHVHFEDVPREPIGELLEQRHRVFPGDGIAPLRRILDVLKRKKYAGALSVEMMDPTIQSMDPYQAAVKARRSVERLLS
ncbi:MAG TPA: sugar phosphate isomerase/epimerase [Vicinamibacterales bacterium]|nr:sugar phosphate isomerase/epimerase [Vicinamibacterales bacterium]